MVAACRYAWLFKILNMSRLGPNGPSTKHAGLDLASRVTDGKLLFLAKCLPLTDAMRSTIVEGVSERCGCTHAHAAVGSGHVRDLLPAQQAIFGGGPYNSGEQPGYDKLQLYAKAADGALLVEDA